MTIIEALAATYGWHTWSIAISDGSMRIEKRCKKHPDGTCRHHSYWMESKSHRASNCDSLESVFSFGGFEDRDALRQAALSKQWSLLGGEKEQDA